MRGLRLVSAHVPHGRVWSRMSDHLPLIAERVETAGELQVIREMGLFGVQGQLFGEPKPWQ